MNLFIVVFSQRILMATILCAVFSTGHVYGHGESMPGPNGGKIRMPGPFHTEAIQEANGIKIFLLDMHFKNPIITKSAVLASIKVDGKNEDLKCESRKDHFFCGTSKLPKSGKLIVKSKRDSIQGNDAEYDLPLK